MASVILFHEMSKIPLNLLYLKYFCDAVRQGTISASAKENFVSQSAISQGIAKLEKILGQELITHQNNLFRLTKEGQIVFEKAHEVFDSLSRLEEALVEAPFVAGRMEFACSHSFALALLPQQLQKAKQKWPDLHVNFRLAHTDMIKELVKKGSVDFGFVLDNDDFSSFECREIYSGQHKLYISKKHGMPNPLLYLLSEERKETSLLKNAFLKAYGRNLPVLMEVSSWEVIASLVEKGIGIGFFPDYVALRKAHLLEEFPLNIEPITYKIYAIFPRMRRIPRAIEFFLDLWSEKMTSP
jgi:DNA-binding transcriptional LysR family regulator